MTLQRDTLCFIGAYHGVTTASDEVSTTLNDNPRSLETRSPWIHLLPMPNLYRGQFRLPLGTLRILHNETVGGRIQAQQKDLSLQLGYRYAEQAVAKIHDLISAGTFSESKKYKYPLDCPSNNYVQARPR